MERRCAALPMFVHPQFDPVAVQLGPLAVRWYGLMYLLAFMQIVILGKFRARQNLLTGWHPRDVDDMLFYGVFGTILGGRLGYVLFYKPFYYLAHPAEVLAIWQGGMSFHGGFIGVLIALWLFARRRNKRWLEVTDFVAPLIPLGLAAGGLGNFIHGELWGRVTRVCARAGCLFGRARDGHVHGTVAVAADDRYRRADDALGIRSVSQGRADRPRQLKRASKAPFNRPGGNRHRARRCDRCRNRHPPFAARAVCRR